MDRIRQSFDRQGFMRTVGATLESVESREDGPPDRGRPGGSGGPNADRVRRLRLRRHTRTRPRENDGNDDGCRSEGL